MKAYGMAETSRLLRLEHGGEGGITLPLGIRKCARFLISLTSLEAR